MVRKLKSFVFSCWIAPANVATKTTPHSVPSLVGAVDDVSLLVGTVDVVSSLVGTVDDGMEEGSRGGGTVVGHALGIGVVGCSAFAGELFLPFPLTRYSLFSALCPRRRKILLSCLVTFSEQELGREGHLPRFIPQGEDDFERTGYAAILYHYSLALSCSF